MRLSRYQLFTWFAIATLVFLVFQLIFVNYLKTFYRNNQQQLSISADESAAGHYHANPRFQMFHRTSKSTRLTQIDNPVRVAELSGNGSKSNNIAMDNYAVRFKVPLDAQNGNKPVVFYQLPFYHRKNLKLEAVFVEDTSGRQSKRVEKSLDEKSLRGIDKKKYEFYLPDAQGMFKCLNSDVSGCVLVCNYYRKTPSKNCSHNKIGRGFTVSW